MRLSAALLSAALLAGYADAHIRGFGANQDSDAYAPRRALKSKDDDKDDDSEETGSTTGDKSGGSGNKSGGSGGGSGGSTGGTDRANIDANGQCINLPECDERGTGVNCRFWGVVNNPSGVNRAEGSLFPLFNRETCIFEPAPCINLKEEYDEALLNFANLVPGSQAHSRAAEVLTIGKPSVCWLPGGEGNQIGACCRWHPGGLEPDLFQLTTTNPCVCNDFTSDKFESGFPGDNGNGGSGSGNGGFTRN